MKKTLLIILLSLISHLTSQNSFSQNFQKYFDRDFGTTNSIGEVGHAVAQTSDGGYIAVGYSDNYGIGMKDIYVVRLNAGGDTLWTKLYGNAGGNDMARAVVQTTDGGFAIAGETQSGAGAIDATITKIDSNGVLLWSKAFGGIKDELGHGIIEMNDEGLVLAGQALSYSANSYDEIFLVKVDKNGALLWSKTLSGGSGELARDIAKTADGGFVITGDESSFNYGPYLAKFNSNGDTTWCRSYRAAYSSYEGFGVNQTADGGYIMAANTYGGSIGGTDMIALKVTSTGAITWTKEIGTINYDYVTDIIQTNDGGYVISGTAMPGGSYYDLVLAKLNSSGSLQWSKNYSGEYGTTYATNARFQVIQTSDQGLMTIGSLYNNFGNTLSALYNGYDLMVVKTDSAGGGLATGCIRNANLQSAPATWTAYGTPFAVTSVSPTVTSSVYVQKFSAGNYGDVAVKINISTTASSCGSCDGSATANPCDSSGYYCSGKNPYSFSWNDNLYQVVPTATGLCIGTYSVTVTDYVGCTGINTATISSGALPTDICLVTVDSTSTKNMIIWEKPVSSSIDSFFIYREIGLNNYVKVGAVDYADLSKFVDTVQGINPNITSYRYKISTYDNCGNESIISLEHKTIHLQISQAIPQGANLSWTDYIGFSFSQYRILRDSNNTNNWQVIDSVSFSITSFTDVQQFNNARYMVEATHPFGCTVTKSVENHNSSRSNKTYPLAPPAPLNVTAAVANSLCNNSCNGSSTASATGGTTPYTYSWSNGQNSATATGLCAGTYSVTVSGSDGSSVTTSVNISEPDALVLTPVSTNTPCGDSAGTATVNVSGGTSPYVFLWSNNAASQAISNLSAGNYYVTVTDSNNCNSTTVASISSIGGPSVTISSADISCYGESNGTATAIINGGTSPYTFEWSNGQISQNDTALSAGSYYLTVTDANSCVSVASIAIAEPSAITLSISAADATCNQSNGSATVTGNGGITPYSYLWSTGGTTQTISNLSPGYYSVTITDANSCTKTISQTIGSAPPPTATITAGGPTTFCQGSSVTLTSGVANAYLWSNAASTQSITVNQTGNFSVTITDATGCNGISSPVNIVVNPNPATPVISQNGSTLACSVSGMSSYSWTFNGNNLSTCNSQYCTCTQDGFYSVAITDANSCISTSSPFSSTGCNVGLEENDLHTAISIFPNPNDGNFEIVLPDLGFKNAELMVLNVLGEVVFQSKISSFKSQISFDFPKGIFCVKVNDGKKIYQGKLVVE